MQRTRRALRDALVELILERGWDEVSVQDVCERADVGRSTFYMHFADKEELLVSGFDDLRQAGPRAVRDPGRRAPRVLGFARGLIEHAHENQRLVPRAWSASAAARRCRGASASWCVELVREDLLAAPPSGPAKEAAVHFLAGALLELLTWWVDTKNPLEAAEVERLFLRMAAPALRVAQA